ncbi:MAG TPA: hypothetical protein VHR45_15625 [Thermoanaerobaculia bacterium]|nr:hypothetical protein [Thermoanaerobaculia bacterium]
MAALPSPTSFDAGFPVTALAQEEWLLSLAVRYSETREGWKNYAEARARAKAAKFPDDVLDSDDSNDPDWEWGRLNWRYDPIPTLEAVHQPLLALFGGSDRNVVATENLPLMRAALERAGNHDVTLIVVPRSPGRCGHRGATRQRAPARRGSPPRAA